MKPRDNPTRGHVSSGTRLETLKSQEPDGGELELFYAGETID